MKVVDVEEVVEEVDANVVVVVVGFVVVVVPREVVVPDERTVSIHLSGTVGTPLSALSLTHPETS